MIWERKSSLSVQFHLQIRDAQKKGRRQHKPHQ